MRYNYILPVDLIHLPFEYPGEEFVEVTDQMVPGVYPYYRVSNYGRVYHRYLNKLMNLALETSGYYFITLATNTGPRIVQIHRLVLLAFVPIENPELYQVNHLDGIKSHNYLSNLEWATRSENMLHAFRTGLHKRPPNTLLTEEQAKQVIELLKTNKYQCKEIAKLLNIPEHIVNSIKKKETWKSLTVDCNFEARPGRLYDENSVRKLCAYFQEYPKPENMYIKDYVYNALVHCGFNNPEQFVDTARKIYSKKYYTNISNEYNF